MAGIALAHPWILWLALPWLLGMLVYWRLQRQAQVWIGARVAPRFRHLFTRLSPRGAGRHTLLLVAMGLCLIVAAAGPWRDGSGEARAHGRVLILVDASASMYATDVLPLREGEEAAKDRLALGKQIAQEVVAELPEHRFALASFSGVATVHLPMTLDRALVREALEVLEIHTFYRNTGSSFRSALQLVPLYLRQEEKGSGGLQVLLLSDGEQPRPEEFGESLEALVAAGVPIHTVAVGSEEGQARVIYDFRDIRAKVKDPKALVEFETHREDRHLQRMAEESGGHFQLAEPGGAALLAAAIRRHPGAIEKVEQATAREDLSVWPLLVFFLAFVFDLLWDSRRPPGSGFAFELERIGSRVPSMSGLAPAVPDVAKHEAGIPEIGKTHLGGTALLVSLGLLAMGCGTPLWRAHVENEKGIAADLVRAGGKARMYYERSIALRERSHVPLHNLARSTLHAGDFVEAHALFQESLEIRPDWAPALYNHGMTLYRWGRAEEDPKGCHLDRTLELWAQARARFEAVAGLGRKGGGFGSRAQANLRALATWRAELEALVASPPPACAPPPSGASGGGLGDGSSPPGGGGAGGGGEGTGDLPNEQDEQGSDMESPPPSGAPPPSSGGSFDPADSAKVRGELRRIAAQAGEEGKFYRRTRPEQFTREEWSNPDAEIWW